jgi:hypothetical protein
MIPVQDEINKRRSKALHHLMASRVQLKDPQGTNADRDWVRTEAARPDGVIPPGWEMAPSTAEFQGNVELLAEAKGEMERMAPNPAVLGRGVEDASGRASSSWPRSMGRWRTGSCASIASAGPG